MLVGAGVDPARTNRPAHRAFFDAENGVGQKHRCNPVPCRRVGDHEPGHPKQLAQIVVGLVVGLVAPPIANEVVDVAEILTDGEKLGPLVPEPQLPMTDDVGIEVELTAAPDLTGAALDANPTGLPSGHKPGVFRHTRCGSAVLRQMVHYLPFAPIEGSPATRHGLQLAAPSFAI